ncbi:MAG: hypothetical protein AOA66_1406 [Candidatus Bathyarchaeota archaeon BA2]|nr:MAG: hypothetical protein AOA66_1406 [Candidatus Bathyarchaeota archaeon BA2]
MKIALITVRLLEEANKQRNESLERIFVRS